ncbi:MAG: Dabb family protein [Rubrobacter sp.]|nr:Dabb family protein [Rubrobacter sp.]
MVDHLVFFAVRDGVSTEDVEDLISSIQALKDEVSSTVDLSVGEDFSGRAGEYTHALFARFEDRAGLQEYMQHPAHLAVVEKLDERTTGRIVADYEF